MKEARFNFTTTRDCLRNARPKIVLFSENDLSFQNSAGMVTFPSFSESLPVKPLNGLSSTRLTFRSDAKCSPSNVWISSTTSIESLFKYTFFDFFAR